MTMSSKGASTVTLPKTLTVSIAFSEESDNIAKSSKGGIAPDRNQRVSLRSSETDPWNQI